MNAAASCSVASSGLIRRVLILGHRGFIGSNLIRFFEEHSPETEVVGRDFPQVDLTRAEQADSLGELLGPETAVIVCAAIKRQLGDNLEAFSSNLQIAVNLCRTLAKYPAGRVIYFSSGAVYGEEIQNLSITEETPPQPTSYYGLAKFTSEGLFRKAVAQSKASSLVLLRPALIYGPGDQGGYGPTGFIKAALAKDPIVLWGDGSEKREFIYVGDVARVVHALTFRSFDGVINVVSGHSYTFMEALDIVKDLIGLSQPAGSRPRSKDKADHGYDNRKLRQVLPGTTFTPLAEGMRLTFAHLAGGSDQNSEKEKQA